MSGWRCGVGGDGRVRGADAGFTLPCLRVARLPASRRGVASAIPSATCDFESLRYLGHMLRVNSGDLLTEPDPDCATRFRRPAPEFHDPMLPVRPATRFPLAE